MIRTYLIQLSTPQTPSDPYDLEELKELALHVGLTPDDTFLQHGSKPTAAFGIGKGKVAELKMLIEAHAIQMVVFFNELSNTQMRNLEAEWGVEVIDRTLLVLELLSQHAQSNLAKKLVAITQKRYLLPRLSAITQISDRQQGGIGLKGPGETALELNRRVLEKDISKLQKAIQKEKKVRTQNRKHRLKKNIPTVSIVGYTNAGKSTLLNHFLDGAPAEKQVFAKNQLFATLEPKSRRIERPHIPPVVFSDTVGFISKMPDHLTQSFIATLEEIETSELILIVLDASSPYLDTHLETTHAMLDQLNVKDIPKLYVLNKMDRKEDADDFLFYHHPYVKISLKTSMGLEKLEAAIIEHLFASSIDKTYLIPFSADHVQYRIKESAWIHQETQTEDGTLLHVKIPPSMLSSLKNYEV
jgi:GTP-binding protein HflX